MISERKFSKKQIKMMVIILNIYLGFFLIAAIQLYNIAWQFQYAFSDLIAFFAIFFFSGGLVSMILLCVYLDYKFVISTDV